MAAERLWPRCSVMALALGVPLLAAVFIPEFRAAVETWNASTAYGHCYLVLPMSLYLLWDRRDLIQRSRPSGEPVWALLGVPIAAAWLSAERLGIMEGRQLAAIAGFQVLFLAVLGRRLYWRLSGPLLYLFFLVPFGAFITPALQHFTARFTVLGLQLLGIPFYIDNFIIETPSGTFLVAEACAGLRFLIAAIAFGVFYALMSFRSPARRIGYILLSIVVPIIANGLRAFGIVFLGQLLGSAEAAAADHIVYGWVFFSVVMLLLVAVGQPFREAAVTAADVDAAVPARSGQAPLWAAVASVLLVAIGPGVASAIDRYAVTRPLASAIEWVSLPGCSPARPSAPPSTVQVVLEMTCSESTYTIEIATYAARSTARPIVAERRRVTRELGAEDVTTTALEAARDDAGSWSVVQTAEPDGVTAYASWVDGRPSLGGLRGRLAQARDSLAGSAYQPVLIMITAIEPGRLASPHRRAVVDQLKQIVDAQGDLDSTVDRASRVGS